jgi:hypothetical protein
MLSHVYDMASMDIRQREGYIRDFLQFYSIPHEIQKFPEGNNIILPSTYQKNVIVCAHYDIRGEGTYGANDNASGVSVIMDLAKRFYEKPTSNIGVIFCFFDREEYDMMGAKWYVDVYGLKGVIGCYNLDLVGIGSTLVARPLFLGQHSYMYECLKHVTDEDNILLQRVVRFEGAKNDDERFTQPGKDAITISALTCEEAKLIPLYNEAFNQSTDKAIEIFRQIATMNELHSEKDHPGKIEEYALQMTSSSIWKAIQMIDYGNSL